MFAHQQQQVTKTMQNNINEQNGVGVGGGSSGSAQSSWTAGRYGAVCKTSHPTADIYSVVGGHTQHNRDAQAPSVRGAQDSAVLQAVGVPGSDSSWPTPRAMHQQSTVQVMLAHKYTHGANSS